MLRFALLIPLAFGQEADLQGRLGEVLDLPYPSERADAARALAAEKGIPLETWRAACRTLAPVGDGTIGRRIEEVQLYADGDLEHTPIAVLVPRTYRAETPAPLLMVLHWTGGDGRQAIRSWEAQAEELGMLLVAPNDTGPNNGYTFSQRERDVTLSALHWAKRQFNVDEDRVFVTGISRGGHLAWELILRHPGLWAGCAPMVGGPYWDLRDGRANLRYLENVLPIALVDLQGAQDQAGLVWNVRYAFEKLAELGATKATYHEFPDRGHSVDMDAVDWNAFFVANRRDPRPTTIVRAFAKPGEGRTGWVEVLEGSKKVEEEFAPTISVRLNAKLDEDGRRRWLIEKTADRTGRLEVVFKGPDRFEAKSSQVDRFRLWLEPDMFTDKGPLVVKVGNRRRKFKVAPSAEVLLVDFAASLDRRFLPVATVEVKR
jgi:predicted esterase